MTEKTPSPRTDVAVPDLTKRLRSVRSCSVCDGDGIKSNGKQCGGCGGVGDVRRYDRTGVEAADEIDRANAAIGALMAKLADLLDEDHFAACEEIVRRAGVLPPQDHAVGETATFFVIEWIAAPRPSVHPNPMNGRQTYRSFERAVLHMKSQAPDAEFISLTERTTVTTSVDRSGDLRAALAATAPEVSHD